ncbi:MAG: VG15 protein [Mycobacteriaceae bacterium]
MATAPSDLGQSPGQDHQIGQAALVGLVPALVAQAWPLLDPHDIKGTLPQFTAAVQAVVNRYGRASATGALDFYRKQRIAAGVTSPVQLRVAPAPDEQTVTDYIGAATSGLYGAVTPESERAALDSVSEAASQLVLDQGRDTIIENAARDPKAKGWVRVTEPGACSFCLMLAIRGGMGVLYKAENTADFKAHDNCRCHAEPVFNAYEPSHDLRQAQALWVKSTKGKSGNDARIAFRQAVEGRTPPTPKNQPAK